MIDLGSATPKPASSKYYNARTATCTRHGLRLSRQSSLAAMQTPLHPWPPSPPSLSAVARLDPLTRSFPLPSHAWRASFPSFSSPWRPLRRPSVLPDSSPCLYRLLGTLRLHTGAEKPRSNATASAKTRRTVPDVKPRGSIALGQPHAAERSLAPKSTYSLLNIRCRRRPSGHQHADLTALLLCCPLSLSLSLQTVWLRVRANSLKPSNVSSSSSSTPRSIEARLLRMILNPAFIDKHGTRQANRARRPPILRTLPRRNSA